MSIHDDLKAYLDGELDSVREQEIKSALTRDPSLRRDLQEIQLIKESLKRHAAKIQPYGLERTLNAINRKEKNKRLWEFRLAWGVGLALASSVAVICIVPLFATAKMAAKSTGRFKNTKSTVVRASNGRRVTTDSASAGAVAMNSPRAAEADRSLSKPIVAIPATPVAPRHSTLSQAKTGSKHRIGPENVASLSASPIASANNTGTIYLGTNQEKKNVSDARQNVIASITLSNSVALAESKAQVVAIEFPTIQQGHEAVVELLSKYHTPSTGTAGSGGFSKSDESSNSMTVEVPEDVADQFVADLKVLSERDKGTGFLGGGFKASAEGKPAAKATPLNLEAAKGGPLGGMAGEAISKAKRETKPAVGKVAEPVSVSPTRSNFTAPVNAKSLAKSDSQVPRAKSNVTGAGASPANPVLVKPKTRRIVIILSEVAKSKGLP